MSYQAPVSDLRYNHWRHDQINDRADDDDIVKEEEEGTFKHLCTARHPYFVATDDTWHIALRLVVHTEAVGTVQCPCAVSCLNERTGNTQHMKMIVQ